MLFNILTFILFLVVLMSAVVLSHKLGFDVDDDYGIGLDNDQYDV